MKRFQPGDLIAWTMDAGLGQKYFILSLESTLSGNGGGCIVAYPPGTQTAHGKDLSLHIWKGYTITRLTQFIRHATPADLQHLTTVVTFNLLQNNLTPEEIPDLLPLLGLHR